MTVSTANSDGRHTPFSAQVEGLAEGASAKAATLIEALPWLARFHGRTVVIKYGGHALADETLRPDFAQDPVVFPYAGLRPGAVHGGGPPITAEINPLGRKSHL